MLILTQLIEAGAIIIGKANLSVRALTLQPTHFSPIHIDAHLPLGAQLFQVCIACSKLLKPSKDNKSCLGAQSWIVDGLP